MNRGAGAVHGDEHGTADGGVAVDLEILVAGAGRRVGDDDRAGDPDGRAEVGIDLVVVERGARPGDRDAAQADRQSGAVRAVDEILHRLRAGIVNDHAERRHVAAVGKDFVIRSEVGRPRRGGLHDDEAPHVDLTTVGGLGVNLVLQVLRRGRRLGDAAPDGDAAEIESGNVVVQLAVVVVGFGTRRGLKYGTADRDVAAGAGVAVGLDVIAGLVVAARSLSYPQADRDIPGFVGDHIIVGDPLFTGRQGRLFHAAADREIARAVVLDVVIGETVGPGRGSCRGPLRHCAGDGDVPRTVGIDV